MPVPLRAVALLTSASVLRLMVAIGLRLLPYRFWQPLLLAAMREGGAIGQGDPAVVERVVRAVVMTERFVPLGRCLERALTAWLMLHRRAACRVRLGAGLDGGGNLFAHAWLEAAGVVVLGSSDEKLSSLDRPGSGGPSNPNG